MESVNEEQAARADQAMQALKQRITDYFAVEGVDGVLTAANPQIEA
jgi:hypothetical protein